MLHPWHWEKDPATIHDAAENDKNTLPPNQKYKSFQIETSTVKNARWHNILHRNQSRLIFAIIRLNTPWYPVETKIHLQLHSHHGDLTSKVREKERILDLLKKCLTRHLLDVQQLYQR